VSFCFGVSDNLLLPPHHLPVWLAALLLSQVLAAALLCTSDPSPSAEPPKYQPVVAYVGFVASVAWIYLSAGEVVSLLKTLGVVSGLSDAVLGLTVLAWGNSVGDMVSDVAAAKRGLSRMGFSACIGGPLFNLLLGMGLPFALVSFRNGWKPVAVHFTPVVLVLGVSLFFSLAVHLLASLLTGCKAGRATSMALFAVYLLSMLAVAAVELQWIQIPI